jgi:DNA-binding response OmpR family regulator
MARILLAESDQRIGGFLAGILVEFGHEVAMCADAAEAGARLAAEPVDVVLTDLMLHGDPEAGLVRNWAALAIPTITLTGHVFSLDHSAPAAPRLIDKPFRFADLRCVIEAVAACTTSAAPRRSAVREAA